MNSFGGSVECAWCGEHFKKEDDDAWVSNCKCYDDAILIVVRE